MRPMTIVASAILALMIAGYAAAQNMPSAVKVTDGVLTDAKGMTLYLYTKEFQNRKAFPNLVPPGTPIFVPGQVEPASNRAEVQ